jgi:hypothetical protein
VEQFEFVVGADYLFGDGSTHGGGYDYTVAPDGSAPASNRGSISATRTV